MDRLGARRMNTITAGVFLCCCLPTVQIRVDAADRPRVARVYVYTAQAAGGPVSTEEQARLDSVRDLREALQHHSDIRLVPTAGEAEFIVEVLSREKRDAGEGGFGGKTVTRFGDTILRLRVKAGQDEAEIKGMGQAYWSRAAKDAADRLVKWIRRKRGRDSHAGRTPIDLTASGSPARF